MSDFKAKMHQIHFLLGLHPNQPSPRNVLRQRLTTFISVYYQILIATHLPTPEG